MPRVRDDLAAVHLGSLTEIVGTFAAPGEALLRASRLSPPVTDDRPIPDYARKSQLRDHRIPPRIFAVREVGTWCPGCFADGQPLPELEHIGTYLGILERLYRAPRFLNSSTVKGPGRRRARIPIPPDAAIEAAVAEHRYLGYVMEGFFEWR